MKTRFIILLFLNTLIYLCGYSQENYSQEPGKITQYELLMTEYEKDKDAEALVLYDFGEYYFQGDDSRGFLLHMRISTKIKILKQAGTEYANFEIPYYSEGRDWEMVDNIKAITYNWDNGILTKTPLDTKNIFEEKIDDNIRVKKIALSAVKEGSVIEFSYNISTPYFFNMRRWNFQRKIPVLYSRLRYKAIPYYEYTYIMKGINKFDEFKSTVLFGDIRFGQLLYQEVEYIFGMKNLPAFRDEEYITSKQDYMVSLNFQMSKIFNPRGGNREIMTTWPAMCNDFLKDDDFGKYIKSAEKKAKKILPTLDLTNKTPIDQVDLISQYVKSKYNWNGIYGKYANNSLSDFIKKKTGNIGNINLFLIGMLKAAGIETYPVVLSTRKNGMVSKGHPFQQFFNYVIAQVKVEDKFYYIDATEPYLYFSDVPERCINVEGLVIKPKVEEWIVVRQQSLSTSQKDLQIKLIPEENKMEVKAKFSGRGLEAYNYRINYLDKEENLSKYLKQKHNITVKDSIKVIEVNKLNQPFIFSFSFDNQIENVTSDKLFIHPFCNLSINDNPFKQTKRSTTIDLVYQRGEAFSATIEIPSDYRVEHLPQTIQIEDKLIKINYSVVQSENKIGINASYSFSKATYPATDYISLKMSFAEIIKKFSEMIVLVKK